MEQEKFKKLNQEKKNEYLFERKVFEDSSGFFTAMIGIVLVMIVKITEYVASADLTFGIFLAGCMTGFGLLAWLIDQIGIINFNKKWGK